MRSITFAAALCAASASAQSLDQVTLAATFTRPAAAYDVLPDGRLLGLTPAGDVILQTSPNASGFAQTNTLAAPNSQGFGASFLSISPDSALIAIGNNEFGPANAVLVYDYTEFFLGLGVGNPVNPLHTVATPNFAATWSGDSQSLFVTGSDASTLSTVVNQIQFSDAAIPPTAATVISPAGSFSGGIAESDGTLLVGAGDSGQVRAFDTAAFPPAMAQPFSAGSLVAASTSASSIDTFGDLVLIAGQVFGAEGNALLIDTSTGESLTLAPEGPDAFYGGYFNHATSQLVVTAGPNAYVYDLVPAPATLALAPMLGLVATRRRRA